MWIERLRVREFPPFEGEQTFTFDRGLAVVTGANGSGKTRLVEAVRGALFGFEKGAAPARGHVEITFHMARREFVLRREFDTGRITLGESGTAGVDIRCDENQSDPGAEERLRETLAALLGTSEDVWLSSGFVRDGILETHLDEAVRAWLMGNPAGDEEAILAQVEGDLTRLSGHDGHAGELGRLREEIEARETLLARWEEAAWRASETREAWQAKETARESAGARVAGLQAQLENLERFEHLAQERARLENVLVELREDRDRIRRHLEAEEHSRALLESEYADFLDAPDDVEEGIHIWIECTNRLQSVDRDLDRLQKSAATIPPSRVARNGVIAAAGLGILSWFAGMGAGEPRLGVFLFPLFASAGFAIVWALERSAERMRTAHVAEFDRLEIEKREAAAALDGARRALGKLAEYETPAALRKHFRGYMEVQEKLERARSQAERLRPLSEIMDDYEEVLSELQVLDTETRALVAHAQYLSGLDADLSGLRRRVETLRTERDEAEGECQRFAREAKDARESLDPVSGDHPEPGRVAEELEALKAAESDLLRRESAARVAADMLREALREYQEDHLERLSERAGKFFESLSCGSFRKLRFGRELEPEVRGDGEWVPATALSRGVRDQLFFSLRLAVSEDGAGDRGLPLVLDEPFRGWDDARVEEARRLLGSLAETGRQCIVVGSDPRLLAWEGAAIRLPGPDESAQALEAA